MFEKVKAIVPWGRKSFGAYLGMKAPEIAIGAGLSGQATNGYRNPYVYACINRRAEDCAVVPWILYSDRTKEKEIERHPILDLLENPNPAVSGYEFRRDLIGYRLLNGNGYMYAISTISGPQEMYLLRPDAVSYIQGSNMAEPVTSWRYSGIYGSLSISPQDLAHWKCWNPVDDVKGISPLLAAALSVQSSNDSRLWNVGQLQSGGKTSGTVTTDKELSQAQRDKIKKEFKEKHAGPENAGKIMVMEGGLHWEQMGMTAVEMDWLEGQKLSAKEIAIIYKTPPEIIGDSANKTYSNYKEAEEAFARSTVLPDLVQLRGIFNRWLVPKYDRSRKLWLDIDTDAIPALRNSRSQLWADLNGCNWMSINEKRRAAGYEDVGAEGDIIFVPATNLPLDYATQPYDPLQEPPA